MKKISHILTALAVAAICGGCMRTITIEKHDPIPVGTNAATFIEGGYTLRYRNVGLKTDVSSISAKKTDSGVTITVKGVATDVSPENGEIVAAGGAALGNIAEKVIEGVKGVEAVKTR